MVTKETPDHVDYDVILCRVNRQILSENTSLLQYQPARIKLCKRPGMKLSSVDLTSTEPCRSAHRRNQLSVEYRFWRLRNIQVINSWNVAEMVTETISLTHPY